MVDQNKSFGDQPIYSQNQFTLKTVVEKQDEMLAEIKQLRVSLNDPNTGLFARVSNLERDQAAYEEWREGSFAEWKRWVDWRFWVHVLISVVVLVMTIINLILNLFGGN